MKTDYEIGNCQEPCGLQSGSLPPYKGGGKTAKPNSDTLAVFQDTTEYNDMQYNDNTGFCCSMVGKCQTSKQNIDPDSDVIAQMKIDFEDADIQRIVERVVAALRSDLLKTTATQTESLMDTQGLARYLGVEISWVNKAVSEKRIPYIKIGKYNKFRKSAIDYWVEQQTVKPIGGSSLFDYRARRKNEQKA